MLKRLFNKDILSIFVPLGISTVAAGWMVFKYIYPSSASAPTPSIHMGSISTNGGDSVVGSGTIDKSTTINIGTDLQSIVALLEKALDITQQQLEVKNRQIDFLQRQFSHAKSNKVSKATIKLADKIPDDTNNTYALSLKAIVSERYDIARQLLKPLIEEQEKQFTLHRDKLAKTYRALAKTEFYDSQYRRLSRELSPKV